MPDYVNIRTAQNVEITYKLAGLGNRVLGKLVDIIIMVGYMIAIAFLLNSLNIDGWGATIFFLPIMLYSLVFEIFNNGQTPGKSITKSKVVSLDGAPLSISQILIRWLLQVIDTWLISGLPGMISMGMGEQQQRLGDRSAGTIVVSLKEDSTLDQTSYVKVNEDYQPKYIQASQLKEKDIRILKTVINDRSDNRYEIMSKAADKIQELLHVKKTTSSQEFLKTIIKDYNYYQQDIKSNDAQEDIPY